MLVCDAPPYKQYAPKPLCYCDASGVRTVCANTRLYECFSAHHCCQGSKHSLNKRFREHAGFE